MSFWKFKQRIGPYTYLTRFFLIPRNRWCNLYLHRYDGPDYRFYGLHDHPWWSLSIRIWGKFLIEEREHTVSVVLAAYRVSKSHRRAFDS